MDIKELRDNLNEKLTQFDLEQTFLENPAFVSVMEEIKALLAQIPVDELEEQIVYEKNKIELFWKSPNQENYHIQITSPNKKTLNCIFFKEKEAYFSDELNRMVTNKTVVEKQAFIDKNRNIHIVLYGAELYNNKKNIHHCSNRPWFEQKIYNANGIMITMEHRDYPTVIINDTLEYASLDSILSIPKNALQIAFQLDPYNYRELLERDKVNTATRTVEDKTNGTKEQKTIYLNYKLGLRNMIIDNQSKEVSIQELTKVIQNEKNPKVREGLGMYTLGISTAETIETSPVLEYRLKELNTDLENKINHMEIDITLKEHPAFTTFLQDIQIFIGQMHLGSAIEKIMVKEQNKNIMFQYNSPYGENYTLSIECANSIKFRTIMTEEKEEYNAGKFKKMVKCKTIKEEIVSKNSNNEVVVVENTAKVYDDDLEQQDCDVRTFATRKIYIDGIVREKEYRNYPTVQIHEAFEMVKNNLALSIPRYAFRGEGYGNQYETRSLFVRDKLDTARIQIEDKVQQINYNSIVPLSKSEGLKDMIIPLSYQSYPNEVMIPKLSIQEIEEMIQSEEDLQVQIGLQKFVAGRSDHYNAIQDMGEYYYISSKDSTFVCQKGLSKTLTQ